MWATPNSSRLNPWKKLQQKSVPNKYSLASDLWHVSRSRSSSSGLSSSTWVSGIWIYKFGIRDRLIWDKQVFGIWMDIVWIDCEGDACISPSRLASFSEAMAPAPIAALMPRMVRPGFTPGSDVWGTKRSMYTNIHINYICWIHSKCLHRTPKCFFFQTAPLQMRIASAMITPWANHGLQPKAPSLKLQSPRTHSTITWKQHMMMTINRSVWVW